MKKGSIKKHLSYNPETGIFVWTKTNKVAGGLSNAGYIFIKFNYKAYSAHRLAWFFYYGKLPKQNIDHINGNPKDNRIKNLRDVSQSENCRNRLYHRKGKTLGVGFHNKRNRWHAALRVNGKTKHLGFFKTKQLALKAYNKFVNSK